MSNLEEKFISLWEMKFPHIDLHREYMFARELKRKYRADFASIEGKVIIEIQGGIYNGRAHGSITGIKKDCEKFFVIAQLGYLLFPLYPEMINIPNLQIIADTITARIVAVNHKDSVNISYQKALSLI